ncbi:MAG: HAMP domain-containing histidine kinase [Clostridia bacterium]|nr:HAMP domain-containing histidine kinase [Clostridia bacterium]
MKKESKSILIDKIGQLAEGNYDTPIETNLSREYGDILCAIEELRVKLRDLRQVGVQTEKNVSDTIASVAHDLKTPIAVILGYAECLEEGIDDKDYLSLIVEKAGEMNEQVLSIVESNRNKDYLADCFELISARKFFDYEVSKHIPLAKSKNLTLKVKKVPDISFFGDKKGLSAVVQNLISNAVKYTDEGGKIVVSFSRKRKHLVVTVRDNGQGIDKKDLPKIFDKFYKGDKARTDGKSNGLGLYSVKEIITHHGGKIEVKSRLNKGTAMSVYLPLEDSDIRHGFDEFPTIAKLIIFLFTYPFNPSFVYRMYKAIEAGDKKRVGALCLAFPVMYLTWLYDMATIIVANKVV